MGPLLWTRSAPADAHEIGVEAVPDYGISPTQGTTAGSFLSSVSAIVSHRKK
jgi:hypothetical protein